MRSLARHLPPGAQGGVVPEGPAGICSVRKPNMKESNFSLINEASGQKSEHKLLSGTQGPGVVDIRNLYASQGTFTFDDVIHVKHKLIGGSK